MERYDGPYDYEREGPFGDDEDLVLIMGCGTLFVAAILLGVVFVFLWRVFH